MYGVFINLFFVPIQNKNWYVHDYPHQPWHPRRRTCVRPIQDSSVTLFQNATHMHIIQRQPCRIFDHSITKTGWSPTTLSANYLPSSSYSQPSPLPVLLYPHFGSVYTSYDLIGQPMPVMITCFPNTTVVYSGITSSSISPHHISQFFFYFHHHHQHHTIVS